MAKKSTAMPRYAYPITPRQLAAHAQTFLTGETVTEEEIVWNTPPINRVYSWLYRNFGRPENRRFEITKEMRDAYLELVQTQQARREAREAAAAAKEQVAS